ncbi:MAG: response regulator [Pseudomonadota bacterium]
MFGITRFFAPAGQSLRMTQRKYPMTEISKDLIAIFRAEIEDNLTILDRALVKLEKKPADLRLVKEMNRIAHTVKGSARVFGYNKIQDVAHKIEDIFEKLLNKKIKFSPKIANAIFASLDVIRNTLVDKEIDITETFSLLDSCLAEKNTPSKGKLKKNIPATEMTKEKVSEGGIDDYIRIPSSRVGMLLNLVGELVINKMRNPHRLSHAKKASQLSSDLSKNIITLTDKLNAFDIPADSEIMNILSQCTSKLFKLKDVSTTLYDEISIDVLQLEPVVEELQSETKKLRMLPLSTIFQNYPRMVRDIATQEEKEVNLNIIGEETELDKKVLEGIKTPIMHIVRNCIDHGIESSDVRLKKSKPKSGNITIHAYHQAGNVLIEIKDDGSGIDPENIKNILIQKNLISNDKLSEMTGKEIVNMVFMDGFSTSPIITDVSGRGIGLDIAKREIELLKGQIILDSVKDEGTAFKIVLPLTIAIIQVLLVKSGGLIFGVPMYSVNECLKIKLSEMSHLEGKMAVSIRDRLLPLANLRDILALPKENEKTEKGNSDEANIIITSSLDKEVGFIVDEICGEEEIFIKSLGPHLGKVDNVAGAAILGTGDVIVILDVGDLIRRSDMCHPALLEKKPLQSKLRQGKRILIVENVLSTRQLMSTILKTKGFEVTAAIDGMDAMDKFNDESFDLIITDILMPRMNGFELCALIRKNKRDENIPIIFVTALEKNEDKKRGIEAGGSAYIVKGSFDQTNLMDTIDRLIG